jgi:CheY-like chemotaxis protein/tetratricopeptide (TPR) repeat protein
MLLCADPSRDLCQMLARGLGADGYRVAVAHDCESALSTLRDRMPDVAIVDVGLPGDGGLGLLQAMRKSATPAASVPVILWSDTPCSPEEIGQARKLGAAALLRKPVPLDALMARLAKLVSQDRETRASARRPKRAAPLRGRLEQIPIPALLHQAHGLRANGVLQLANGERRKEVELRDGRPAAVRSNLPGERLGEWLLRSGRIEPAVLAESARRLLRGEGLQGQILVGMQVLSEMDLAGALREQAEEKLLEIFEWTSGGFALAFGAKLGRATALPIAASAADLICKGVRTRFAIERIDASLRAHQDDIAITSANPFYSFQEVELGSDEKKLLEACARGVAVSAVLNKSERVRRVAYALMETGLLELRDGATFRRGGHAPVVRLHDAAAPEVDRTPPVAMPKKPAKAPAAKPAAAPAAAKPAPAPKPAPPSRPAPIAVPIQTPKLVAPTNEDHSHYAADHDQRAALTELLERLGQPSPFARFGLDRDATEEQIRSAYMRMAKETHPDRYSNASQAARDLAAQAFREVTRTFEILSDPERLALYREDPNRDRKEAQALEEAQRAIAAEREFQRGESRLGVYDWSGALGHFTRAVELYPDEGEYHAYCGWAYYLTHGHSHDVFRKAFEQVKYGAKLAPEREKPYLFLGRLCQAASKLELAERMFTKAVECRPDSIEALRELRLLQMRRPKQGLLGRLLRRPGEKSSGRRGAE